MTDGQVYNDTPISSGKRSGMTPTGSFTVLQKNADHRSNIYRRFRELQGARRPCGSEPQVDSRQAAPLRRSADEVFLPLTWSGIGMHVASCRGIQLPMVASPSRAHRAIIYRNVKLGTPVSIEA
jgi:hypothetical protein